MKFRCYYPEVKNVKMSFTFLELRTHIGLHKMKLDYRLSHHAILLCLFIYFFKMYLLLFYFFIIIFIIIIALSSQASITNLVAFLPVLRTDELKYTSYLVVSTFDSGWMTHWIPTQ